MNHRSEVMQDRLIDFSVLVCRLVEGRQTLVHRKLWPALVRVGDRFADDRVSRVREEHTATGRHVTHDVPFPGWVPAEVLREGRTLSEAKALALFGRWLSTSPHARPRASSTSS